jgi:hypothetical protein
MRARGCIDGHLHRQAPAFARGAAIVKSVHRLGAWQRLTLYGSGAVLLLSGAAWLAIHYGRASDALPAPLEAWLMRLHGLAAFAALFTFGALAAAHIPHGWRFTHRRKWTSQRSSGLLLCALAATLALTAYLLYYFAPDNIRPALGWLHSGLGAAMTLLVLAHRRND